MTAQPRTGRYPILYSFRRCPYAIRARLALSKACVVVELREVVLRNKPPELLALSSKATVPVLQLANGQVLDESLDIMQWALRQHDPHGWLDAFDAPWQRALLACNDGPFKLALDRYKYPERHPEQGREDHRRHAETALIDELDSRLNASSFIGGAAAGLIDVAIFPFVRQFAAVDAVWFEQSRWVHTRRWLRRWSQDPLFTGVMIKTIAWTRGQARCLINEMLDGRIEARERPHPFVG